MLQCDFGTLSRKPVPHGSQIGFSLLIGSISGCQPEAYSYFMTVVVVMDPVGGKASNLAPLEDVGVYVDDLQKVRRE